MTAPQPLSTTEWYVSNEVGAWFFRERGITSVTLAAFGVQTQPDGAVSFPYPHGPKLRYGLPTGERQFRYPSGLALDFFMPTGDRTIGGRVLVAEGETDTMRLWQELSEAGVGDRYCVVGIPGVEAWTEQMARQLRSADEVLVFLDNDPPHSKAKGYDVNQVDRAWGKMRRSLGALVKRVDLAPSGCKDLCEFFQRFSLSDMKGLVEAEPSYHYAGIDFRKPGPTKVDWLIERLIGKGDRAMLIGDPATGKTWLAMALAVAIAKAGTGEDARWLGERPSICTGRVLYVDEENPEAEVYRRLQLLGLSPAAAANIRYVSQAGVRLDHQPEQLLDDAISWRPDLVVLDSLARFHTQDEQSAGDMARLFRDGITPLARESGAAVLCLHHKIKSGSWRSGLVTARGSGDLTASIDQGLDVKQDDHGTIKIHHYKARRSLPHAPIRAAIYDENQLVRVGLV